MVDHTDPRLAPQARYILPSFIEHSSWGVKESNPYNLSLIHISEPTRPY